MSIEQAALLHEVFPEFTDEDVEALLDMANIHTYPPEVTLCHEGAYEGVFYILADGYVEVTKRFGEGKDAHVIRITGPGEFFGEMELIQSLPRAASVRTITEVTVLEIDREAFQEAMQLSPSMAMPMLHAALSRLRSNDQLAMEALEGKHYEIEAAYHKLARQEHLRSEFLTTLAHELRTPLTSAQGFMHLVQQGKLQGPSLEMAMGRIGRSIEQLVTLVNDLLFLQELELIQPAFAPVHVDSILRNLVEMYHEPATDNGLKIVTDIMPDVPNIQGDCDSLERALGALLDNAIKFSPAGGTICIAICRADDHIEIAFTDPGIGIPEDFIRTSLFKRFERRDSVDGHLFGGVGLGLPIARHLVEMHGGRIRVESEMGAGSTFTVRLPLETETVAGEMPVGV